MRGNWEGGRRTAIGGVLAACLAFAAFVPSASASLESRYIVVYEDSVSSPGAKTAALAERVGFQVDFRYDSALKGFAAELSHRQLTRIRTSPAVAFVSRDRRVHAVGTAPLAPGDSAPTGVRRIEAATTTSVHEAANSSVAVIDTGVDLTHSDLNASNGTNCVTPGVPATDDNGHGSHVAGTIAAKNNGSGVVGVAPGTKVVAVKVLNAIGAGLWSQVICGVDWVTANAASRGITVANMSLGGSGSNDNNCGASNKDALHAAICNSTDAGVTYVVAAGNDGADFAGSVPAAYPEALTVTAMSDSDGAPGGAGGAPRCRTSEKDDYYATFSNYAVATTEVDHAIAGPGVCIRSTWLLGTYNTISGTSMASPHVAGTVALCLGNGGAAGPCDGLRPDQIIDRVRSDAEAHATSTNGFIGDPLNPVTFTKRKTKVTPHFGYLAWAGGY